MKKLFLSLIILCSVINPMFGMDDEDRQEAPPCGESVCEECLGVAALSAMVDHLNAGNSHLVRSIACEWHEQNPSGTYRDFVNRYNGVLPVRLMRAVWLEVLRARQIGLVRTLADQARLAEMINIHYDIISMLDFMDLRFRGPVCQLALSNTAQPTFFSSYNCGFWKTGVRGESINSESVAYSLDSFIRDGSACRGFIDTMRSGVRHLLGYQALPIFCVITMLLTEQPLSLSLEAMQRLRLIIQSACQRRFCVLIRFVSRGANDNISHIVVVHSGVIAVVPAIVVPVNASYEQCQQITQAAIACAIDHQPVFSTIPEAIQYLEGLGI